MWRITNDSRVIHVTSIQQSLRSDKNTSRPEVHVHSAVVGLQGDVFQTLEAKHA